MRERDEGTTSEDWQRFAKAWLENDTEYMRSRLPTWLREVIDSASGKESNTVVVVTESDDRLHFQRADHGYTICDKTPSRHAWPDEVEFNAVCEICKAGHDD